MWPHAYRSFILVTPSNAHATPACHTILFLVSFELTFFSELISGDVVSCGVLDQQMVSCV